MDTIYILSEFLSGITGFVAFFVVRSHEASIVVRAPSTPANAAERIVARLPARHGTWHNLITVFIYPAYSPDYNKKEQITGTEPTAKRTREKSALRNTTRPACVGATVRIRPNLRRGRGNRLWARETERRARS